MQSNEQKLREAVFTVLEGCTLNHGVRKILEAAYYAPEALALPTADHIPDAGEMVADHLPEAGKMIETAAPVGERELPPIIAYRLDYPASEGVGLPRFFGADDGERAHTFAFNHKATITELCDRAALSAGDAVDAQRYRWLMENVVGFECCPPTLLIRLPEDVVFDFSNPSAAIDAAMRKGQL